MKNVKKFVLGMGASALCLCAVAFGHNSVSSSKDLWAENIEALTDDEYETYTTWTCSGTPITVQCSASCGVCGTTVSGAGTLSGTHKCWIKKDQVLPASPASPA